MYYFIRLTSDGFIQWVIIFFANSPGVWAIEAAEREALTGDRGLALKSKAKHAAIAVPLKKQFTFSKKPLVVQYEVNLQNGQECGGAYIKVSRVLEDNNYLTPRICFDISGCVQGITSGMVFLRER